MATMVSSSRIGTLGEDLSKESMPLPFLLGRASRPQSEKVANSKISKVLPVKCDSSPGLSCEADPYPANLWNELGKYLENLARLVRCSSLPGSSSEAGKPNSADAPHVFRGGCAGMAAELQQRRLPFLDNMRLEQICDIVKLAVEKQLVAEEDGLLVPTAVHATKRNVVPEALPKQFLNHAQSDSSVVQSLSELCRVVQGVLRANGGCLDLSKLKAKILETMNVRVNETLFGCTKLLDVMRLPALAQLFHLEKEPGRSAYRISLFDGSQTAARCDGMAQAPPPPYDNSNYFFAAPPLEVQPQRSCLATAPASLPSLPLGGYRGPAGWDPSTLSSLGAQRLSTLRAPHRFGAPPGLEFEASLLGVPPPPPPPPAFDNLSEGFGCNNDAPSLRGRGAPTLAPNLSCLAHTAASYGLAPNEGVSNSVAVAQIEPPPGLESCYPDLCLVSGTPAYVPLPKSMRI